MTVYSNLWLKGQIGPKCVGVIRYGYRSYTCQIIQIIFSNTIPIHFRSHLCSHKKPECAYVKAIHVFNCFCEYHCEQKADCILWSVA